MIGYHFAGSALRDGSPLPAKGVELPPITTITPCMCGYHASERAIDALMYAPGPWVARVELRGELVAHGNPVDKHVATVRIGLTDYVDATDTLRHFARLCALDVIHVWKAPDVVLEYLETGRDDLRLAARSAAWSAAEATTRSAAESAAAWSAVWSAVWLTAGPAAESAAESAARSAARLAAESAAVSAAGSAAGSAAESAAWSAAWSAAEATTRSAAVVAALSAVWSTAGSAAESAAKSTAGLSAGLAAESAAWLAAEATTRSAAESAQNTRLQNMLDELWK